MTLALGANTWVGYFPSVASLTRWIDDKTRKPVAEFPRSAVDADAANESGRPVESAERVTTTQTGHAFLTALPSTTKGVPDTGAWVYLPPGYDAESNIERYPVVYTLHGAPGSAADWFAGGRLDYVLDTMISGGYLPPLIVVSPDLNAGSQRIDDEPLNRPGGPQLEDFVTQDVVAWADRHLRTVANAEHRIVAGMSAGGIASLLYGLHSPSVFGGVVSIMPYATPYTPQIVGDDVARRLNSPLEVIAARPGPTDQKVFLGQGDGESSADAERILESLRTQGQTATLRVLPGLNHNWTAARMIMPYGLVWVSEQLGWPPR